MDCFLALRNTDYKNSFADAKEFYTQINGSIH